MVSLKKRHFSMGFANHIGKNAIFFGYAWRLHIPKASRNAKAELALAGARLRATKRGS